MKQKLFATIFILLLTSFLFSCNSSNSNNEHSTPGSVSSDPISTSSKVISPTISIDELCESYKEFALTVFETCEVSHKDSEIIITVSSDGLASSLASIKESSDNSDWVEFKDNFISKVKDWMDEANSAGYSDISVDLYLKNDAVDDEYLLKICDGEVTYDALTDENATLTIQKAIPDPVTYTGSGDDVITLDPFDGVFVFHISGNQSKRHFSVKGYDINGNSTGLFVNTTSTYDGITVDPSQETTMLEVSATGNWTVEVQSILSMSSISSGETLSGSGDSVVLVSSYGNTASISGNAEGHHFSVKTYGNERDKLLVNTTDAYSGTVMLTGDPFILEIDADGAWSITFD